MTDSEIVKALRCCADRYCKGCSEHEKANCKETIAALAWELITRQQAEIEELKRSLNTRFEEFESEYDSKIKSEARSEFAERVKAHSYIVSDESQTGIITRYSCVTVNQIDNLLKELEREP